MLEMSLQAALVELGFSQQEAEDYCDLFRSHDITQSELMSLDHELLKVHSTIIMIRHRSSFAGNGRNEDWPQDSLVKVETDAGCIADEL